MEEETALPVGKLFIFVATQGQGSATHFDILLAATTPGALGRGEDVGVDVVHGHNGGVAGRLGVVPRGTDGAGNVVGALLGIIDVALIDAHHVGIDVEVVGIVIAAVDVG